MNYQIYPIKTYSEAHGEFIKTGGLTLSSIDDITRELEQDKHYHFRIHKKQTYIFFGDIDGYNKDIKYFISLLQKFLSKNFDLKFVKEEFLYTQSDKKSGSYHYSIPKWHTTCEYLKKIHTLFFEQHKDEFTVKNGKKTSKCIDTTIYSEHWFRCPNQTKGNDVLSGIHIIKNGSMKDFVIDYIPSNSTCITNHIEQYQIKNSKTPLKQKVSVGSSASGASTDIVISQKPKTLEDIELEIKKMNSELLSNYFLNPELYMELFDKCYKKERFDDYEVWIRMAMSLINTFYDIETAFFLFNYFSEKGETYGGVELTRQKFNTFHRNEDSTGLSSKSISHYAIQDNKEQFIEIMNRYKLELGPTDMCQYLKVLAGKKFIYQSSNGNYKLYCYNERFWEKDDVLIRSFISSNLHDFLKMILTDGFWGSKDFVAHKKTIDRLKNMSIKKEIIETYKEYGVNNTFRFDEKWFLFGFNNLVYDMKECCFRNYRYDDYITITTGYDWREPTDEEMMTMMKIIDSIMPIPEEKELYLQILATCLDGRCLEKFIIFNGGGRNGKGMLNDLLLLGLGQHALVGNNSILFEKSKTGANPEKANIHKKRLVLFREPPAKNKFENSIVKELTGGGIFSSRTLHEKETEKELNLTMIVECNKRPLFTEEPTEAETQRIIDVYFRSTFTTDESQLDSSNFIFKAELEYKTKEFQEKHKYALMKILIDKHNTYYHKNNSVLSIPKTIVDRTRNYLDMSCNIIQFFKDNYEKGSSKDYLKISDIFSDFKVSEYYESMTKQERRKYNYKYFLEYIQTDRFFKKMYQERAFGKKSILSGWKKQIFNSNESDT